MSDQNTSSQDQPVTSSPSVLGVDPTDEPSQEFDFDAQDEVVGAEKPVPKPVPTPAQPEEVRPAASGGEAGKEKVSLSHAEHARLMEQASAYKLIQEDPHLASYVGDHFRRMLAGGPVDQDRQPTRGDVQNGNEEMTRLQRRVEKAEQIANRALVARFVDKHPDAEKYGQDIVRLVKDNGHDLETAYKIAKAMKATDVSSQQAEPTAIPEPTAESRGPGIRVQDEDDSVLEAARKKIDDPNRQVSIGDAFDTALQAAIRAHGG